MERTGDLAGRAMLPRGDSGDLVRVSSSFWEASGYHEGETYTSGEREKERPPRQSTASFSNLE